jgi:hypothetical protein
MAIAPSAWSASTASNGPASFSGAVVMPVHFSTACRVQSLAYQDVQVLAYCAQRITHLPKCPILEVNA